MSSASDLLNHFKLDAKVFSDYTLHTSYRANRTRGLRKEKVEDKWERQRSIGQGSFGEVWLEVKCQGTGAATEERAVKIINKNRMRTFNIDYRRELSALAIFSKSQHLQEEVLVRFLGWYENPEVVYLAMEYFEYGDLGQYLTETFAETDVKQITSDLLEGLKIMHAEGFTHRDLKPANIFVVQKPPAFPSWWIKLGDFGITKRLDNEQTALRTQIGTRNFQAPEITGCVQDEDDDTFEYTNAVDIWSLGCVMYNVIAQQAPFPELRRLQKYCDGRVPFPEGPLKGRLSVDGIEFVKALLSPSPSKRPTAEKALQTLWLQDRFEIANSAKRLCVRSTHTTRVSLKDVQLLQDPAVKPVRVTEVDTGTTSTSSMEVNKDSNSSLQLKQKMPVFSSNTTMRDIDPIPEKRSIVSSQERVPSPVSDDKPLYTEFDDLGEPQRQLQRLYDARCEYQSTKLHSSQQLLEEAGFYIHSEAYKPSRAMSWALSRENLNIIRFLLSEGGTNVEMRLPSGLLVLQRAAEIGHEATVRLLIEKGADVNAKGVSGVTALYIASTCGHTSVVRLLYDKNADIDARNTIRGFTALQEAIKDRNETMVNLLVSLGANVNAIDGLGFTPLYYATIYGLAPVVRLLIDHKANVNATHTDRRFTALHYAIDDDKETMVNLLVSLGADIGRRTSSGSTALHLIAHKGNERMLTQVLQWKVCGIDGRNRWKETALLIAAGEGHDILVKRLLEQGANFRIKNSDQNTALHEALIKGGPAKNKRLIVQYLLGWGADPNVQGGGQKTALHLAAMRGDVEIVRQLLGAGADVLSRDDNGKRALETLPEDASKDLKRLLTWLPTRTLHPSVISMAIQQMH